MRYRYEKTVLGWNYHVVNEKDNRTMFHPNAKELKDLKRFCAANKDILEEKMESESNYGLAFFACGYDGQYQQDFIEYWDERGVSVF